MGKCLFVTGTGTDIGKTFVTGLIVKKLVDSGINAGYYKAAISGIETDAHGNLTSCDALYVKNFAGLKSEISDLVSYLYKEPLSPHLAAKINNRPIEFSKLERDFNSAKNSSDFLTIEGSGGIICPLRRDDKEIFGIDDMVKKFNLPVLIVALSGLGTINSVVLTVEYLRARQIPIKGIIFNYFHPGNIMEEDNLKTVEEITKIPVVAKVCEGDTELKIDINILKSFYE